MLAAVKGIIQGNTIVVSDTTPIISLIKIDKLDILKGMFGEVHFVRH